MPDSDTITNAIRIDRTLDKYGWSDIIYANGAFLTTNQTHSLMSTDGINWRRLRDADCFFQEGIDITEDVFTALATDFMKKEDTINPNQIVGDGTINSKLHIKGAGIPLTVQSTNADTVFVQFCNPDREIIGHLGVGAAGPYYKQGVHTTYHKIYHAGNIADVIAPLEARIAELEAKLANMTTEPWTFTTEEGEVVNKNVYVEAKYSEGLTYSLNADGATYSVTGIGDCTDTNVVIPRIYLGLPVTSIGDNAFAFCGSFTSITIPDSVTRIGVAAFELCANLTSVNYDGTVAQWNAISKGSSWDLNTDNYTVYCTDGNITKA